MNTDKQIIESFGGNEVVAEICTPTLPAVVSGWKKRGIPKAWRRVLEIHSPHHFAVCHHKNAPGVENHANL